MAQREVDKLLKSLYHIEYPTPELAEKQLDEAALRQAWKLKRRELEDAVVLKELPFTKFPYDRAVESLEKHILAHWEELAQPAFEQECLTLIYDIPDWANRVLALEELMTAYEAGGETRIANRLLPTWRHMLAAWREQADAETLYERPDDQPVHPEAPPPPSAPA